MRSKKIIKPDGVALQTIEQLQQTIKTLENEIVELQTQLIDNTHLKWRLETDIRHLNEQLVRLEQVKVDEKASKSIWKILAAAAAAIGALIMSIFDRNDK
jgi:septal ring factor EnvC (AmiA/AmiB activator)